jgi:hypothetical protein
MSSQHHKDTRPRFHLAALAGSALALVSGGTALADSPAMTSCPTQFFLTGNLAPNSNFETPAPSIPVGHATCWAQGLPTPPPSAANGWTMHTSNDQDRVCSQLLPSTAPEPTNLMLKFIAGGNEGGVFELKTRQQHVHVQPGSSCTAGRSPCSRRRRGRTECLSTRSGGGSSCAGVQNLLHTADDS